MTFYKKLTSFADALLPSTLSGGLRSAIRERRRRSDRLEQQRRVAHWAAHKTSPETLKVEVQPGVWLELFYDSDLCRLIYFGGYEQTERKFLNSFLRPGDVFIDVGSNIGLYSVTVSKIVGPGGRVCAFEPCQRTLNRLNGNLKLNRCENVTVYPLALSDQAGETNMTVSLDGYDGWNSLAPKITGSHATVETVRTSTWDEMSESVCKGDRVTMMKVDIEGWESRFLAGAAKFLSRENAPLLQLEFNDENAKAVGSSGREVYQALTGLGYKLFKYTGEPTLYPEPIRDEYSYVNLFATKHPEEVVSRLSSSEMTGWIY